MFEIQHWGLIDYNVAWNKQKELVKEIQEKRNKNVLVLCEHPAVITIGRAGSKENVIAQQSFLNMLGIQVIENDRGGDVTLHNPGQIVGYPIFNLSSYKEDLHWFLREIEECIIETVAEFNIIGDRISGMTGVWIENERKICAMGMHCSRWVTSHGFALNVNNDINQFSLIVPCGIQTKKVTSISNEIGTHIDMINVEMTLIEKFKNHF
jgi:lipoyl(octanoyl) transferase